MVPERRQHILLPVRLSTIVVSFALALLINFLPWRNVALAPDFVALTLAFCAITLSRRILWFGLWTQALHVAALLLLAQAVGTVVRLATGAEFPGWALAVGPLGGALLWPLVSLLLLAPQRRALKVDETRPI